MFYLKRKKKAIEALKDAETTYKNIGNHANHKAIELYSLRKGCSVAINNVEAYLTILANSPQNYKKEVASVQVSIKDFNEAVKIEKEYSSGQPIEASISGAGLMGGSAIAALGPTAAMTIATTFGTASTGTAIASLFGAAATNAALAWLGGGAMAIGGGGMAAGQAFLALAGPVGWGIAGVLGVGGGILNKKAAEKAGVKYISVHNFRATQAYRLYNSLKETNLYTEEQIKKMVSKNLFHGRLDITDYYLKSANKGD